MNNAFHGKLAFISGGASGIGLAIARTLAARGLKIAISDIDDVALEAALTELPDAIGLQLDVRDRAGWVRALDAAEARQGPLSVLICNAGVAGSRLPVAETTAEGWEWTRSVVLDGTFNGLNLGVPRLLAHGGPAHVVATASLGALLVQAGNGAYSAAKAGVVALCEALQGELSGTNVRASVLLPGLVRSNLLDANERRAPAETVIGAHEPELHAALQAGLDPDTVATIVADAIGTDRFWLFTHPELHHHVVARAQAMTDAATAVHA